MDEIAKFLGVSKKTIYKHFASKEDLLDAVLENRQKSIMERLNPIYEDEIEFFDKLVKIGAEMAQVVAETPMNFLLDLQRNAPDLFDLFRERKKNNVLRGFGDFLNLGIKEGVIRNDIPEEIVKHMYLACMENLITPEFFIKASYTPVQIYHYIIKVFFEGILSESGRNKCRETFEPFGKMNFHKDLIDDKI